MWRKVCCKNNHTSRQLDSDVGTSVGFMDVNEVVSLVCCFWKRGRDAGRKNVHGMEVEWRRLDDESCCKCFWIDEDGNFGSWVVKPTHKEHISCQEQTSVEESVTYRYPWSGSVYRRSSVFRHLPPVLLGIQWSWIGCWWVSSLVLCGCVWCVMGHTVVAVQFQMGDQMSCLESELHRWSSFRHISFCWNFMTFCMLVQIFSHWVGSFTPRVISCVDSNILG